MAKIHILDTSDLRHEANLVFHIPTPTGNNFAGVAFSLALKEYLGGSPVSRIVDLVSKDPTHDAGIKNGTIYECTEQIKFNANISNAEKATLIDALYQSRVAAIQQATSNRLNFWGLTRNPA